MAPFDDFIREIYANMSWYKLNSNYNDTTYQNLLSTLSYSIRNSPRTNFSIVGDVANSVIDTSVILRYGNIPCSAPGKEAYLDSDISCLLFQLPYFLEKIQFSYICLIVILPIMLISLFGKIKESYRWFLLNQAIWDIFMCYSFLCEKPSLLAWSGGGYQKFTTCFYNVTPIHPFLDAFFLVLRMSFRNAPYIPLFLLAFSRCISLYFPHFYQRNNQSWKIITFIAIFNVTIMLFGSSINLSKRLLTYIRTNDLQVCFDNFCRPQFQNWSSEYASCLMRNEKYFQCHNRVGAYYDKFVIPARYSTISVTPAMVFLVLICVLLLFTKILFQLKYQLKHNRYAFLKTIKVAAVILIQSFTLTFYLIVTAFQTYLQFEAWGDFVTDTRNYESLPYSLYLLQSYATTTSLNIMRIFFDSFIVLTVLSGYRKRIYKFFAFIFCCFKNPFFFKKFRVHRISTTKITVKSIAPK